MADRNGTQVEIGVLESDIIRELERRGTTELYEDEDFPANDSSLYKVCVLVCKHEIGETIREKEREKWVSFDKTQTKQYEMKLPLPIHHTNYRMCKIFQNMQMKNHENRLVLTYGK